MRKLKFPHQSRWDGPRSCNEALDQWERDMEQKCLCGSAVDVIDGECWACRDGRKLFSDSPGHGTEVRRLVDKILASFDAFDSNSSSVLHGERLLSAIREGIADGTERALKIIMDRK